MSNPPRKRRNRNRSSKASNSPEGKARKGGHKAQKREPQLDPREFWGDPEALPEPITEIRQVPDVKSVVSSLGRIPISGQETAAEHWFSLVYERAGVLAGALAAAGDLLAEDGSD